VNRRSAWALLLFCALSVVWTRPLGFYLASRIPNDPGDPVLNTYLLGWNATTPPFTSGWWDPPFFFPMRGALALSEHLAGLTIISSPVQLLGGTPVLAYNISFLASFALSGWFTYLLVYRLTGSIAAAIVAGIAYGFAPFRAGQLAHLQVLTSQWLPLQILAMHAYLTDRRRRWLVVCGGAWLLQGLSNGYYLLFAPVLTVLWIAWFPRWRRDTRSGLELAAAWGTASLLFVPFLLKYREVHGALGLTRPAEEIVKFSAQPASFLNAPSMLAFWSPRNPLAAEDFLFPGITVIVVILAAATVYPARRTPLTVFSERSALFFYTVSALVLATLTFGPGEPDSGATQWLRPYYWLTLLPGFDSLRVPSRFAMLSALCLAVAAGLGMATLQAALVGKRFARAGLMTAVMAGLVVDGWMKPIPLQLPPGRQILRDVPANAAVLEVPPDEVLINVFAMYRALYHRRPLINGYSGHVPPHYDILGQSLRRGDPSAVLELARGRPLAIIVSDRYDSGGEFRAMVESLPGVTRTGSGSAGAVYLLPAKPRERVSASGLPMPMQATTLPRAHVVFDLGESRTVRTIEFPLRWHYPELGGRLEVEASRDGVTWQVVSQEWTAGRALAGALEDPRVVPFRLPLADITTRYLRIHPAPEWMIRELRILGP
jgi:hypothetical protein